MGSQGDLHRSFSSAIHAALVQKSGFLAGRRLRNRSPIPVMSGTLCLTAETAAAAMPGFIGLRPAAIGMAVGYRNRFLFYSTAAGAGQL